VWAHVKLATITVSCHDDKFYCQRCMLSAAILAVVLLFISVILWSRLKAGPACALITSAKQDM